MAKRAQPAHTRTDTPADDELRRLSVEMRYLEQTAEALQQRIGMVNAAITDLTYANATLDGIEKRERRYRDACSNRRKLVC